MLLSSRHLRLLLTETDLGAGQPASDMDRPDAEETGDDVESSDTGHAYAESLHLVPQAIQPHPPGHQGRVGQRKGPHVAVEGEREWGVVGHILHILAQVPLLPAENAL